MLHAGRIKAAADEFMATALLGQGWEDLLARFAEAAGAREAVLMRNSPVQMVAAVATPIAASAIDDFMAGRAPPNSRYTRVRNDPAEGFRFDHDDYTDDELARDPFYQDFLRPKGVFWHANVVVMASDGEHVELSLKRRIQSGPYARDEAVVLNSILPELRAAARVARHTLNAEAHGMSWLLAGRGNRVIELDGRGQVLAGQYAGEPQGGSPLRVRGRRLMALDATAQPALERAVAAALPPLGHLGHALLGSPDGRRYILQVHPVPGRVRDVFLSAAAIAVLIDRDPLPIPVLIDTHAIRDLFGLTEREAAVAALLAEGLTLGAISRRLGVHGETVRTHLKGAFHKTGVTRQAELVALLAKLAR